MLNHNEILINLSADSNTFYTGSLRFAYNSTRFTTWVRFLTHQHTALSVIDAWIFPDTKSIARQNWLPGFLFRQVIRRTRTRPKFQAGTRLPWGIILTTFTCVIAKKIFFTPPSLSPSIIYYLNLYYLCICRQPKCPFPTVLDSNCFVHGTFSVGTILNPTGLSKLPR